MTSETVMVPRVPTEAMIEAAHAATPVTYLFDADPYNIWSAMLAATPPVQGEAVVILRRLFDEKRPAYHDCIDAGEMQCAWCDAEDFLAATPPAGGEG